MAYFFYNLSTYICCTLKTHLMTKNVILSLLCAFLFPVAIHAQKCPVNFDKIITSDFDLDPKTVDTSYGAVILADVGKSSFEANNKGYFSLIYKFQRRVKIIGSKGFDLATVKIPLYRNDKSNLEESLESVSATTYNIVNGKVEATKFDKDNIFKEVVDKKRVIKKFTLPAVKEGSILDISYTIKSDFLFNLQPWSFQGSYPRLWSEYNLNLPEYFDYAFVAKGNTNFFVKESKYKATNYVIRIAAEIITQKDDLISINSNNSITRWVMKDVPALIEESYTSSLENYLSKIEFQLIGRKFPETPYEDIMGSWGKASVELLKDPEFGGDFKEPNSWADNYINSLNLNKNDTVEMAKTIYYSIQKNFTSDGIYGIYASQPLKKIFESKKGYVQDINLLLTMLLKKVGLNAFPLILSTRENGIANNRYPILSQYNYVITKLETSKGSFFLDASKPTLKFGSIPSYCYNGTAVLIDYVSEIVPMYAFSLLEKKITAISLLNDSALKNVWKGSLSSMPGYYESFAARKEIKEKGRSSFDKRIIDSYSGEYAAENVQLKNEEDLEKDLQVNYNINIERDENANIIYFNPMLKEGMKENLFKNPDRKYPVELPFKMDETYYFKIQIPAGFVVDETPKSVRATLNEADGNFEYIITKNDTEVSLKTQLKLNKTFFSQEDYEVLREFFDMVVKKHAEQIVFKKK